MDHAPAALGQRGAHHRPRAFHVHRPHARRGRAPRCGSRRRSGSPRRSRGRRGRPRRRRSGRRRRSRRAGPPAARAAPRGGRGRAPRARHRASARAMAEPRKPVAPVSRTRRSGVALFIALRKGRDAMAGRHGACGAARRPASGRCGGGDFLPSGRCPNRPGCDACLGARRLWSRLPLSFFASLPRSPKQERRPRSWRGSTPRCSTPCATPARSARAGGSGGCARRCRRPSICRR